MRKEALLTKGCFAQRASQTMKKRRPRRPTTSATIMFADCQRSWMPPNVKAIAVEHVAAMTKKFPLKKLRTARRRE
jgi:hypothetical protein